MTNKINGIDVSEEIIIDKVNVAECKYLICDSLNNCECKAECTIYPETVIYDDCRGINCYFKQLQLANKKIDRLENLLIKRINVYQRQKKKLEQIMEIVKNNQFCQQVIDIKNIILESRGE
mgnify:CR=1 FL=1